MKPALLPLLLLAAFAAQAQVAPPRDARNASYWWRIDNPPADPLQAPYGWYRPLATIAGAPGPFLPRAEPGKTTLDPLLLDAAVQFAEGNASQALIVVHRGVVQVERYFGGAKAEDVFSSHSFAKTLAALAVGAAIADGRIASLDEKASDWLHEWRDDARKSITLRQLLTMSGGFRNAPSSDPASHFLQLHYGSDVEAIVRDAPLAYPPDRGFAYDNDNLHPVNLVIERATGKAYHAYVASRIWQRVGAADAEVLLDRDGGRAMMFCCIWGQPRDWVRLAQMLLDGGLWRGQRVLPAAFVDALRKPSVANPNFGLQVSLGSAWSDPRLNRRAEAHGTSLAPAAADDLYYFSGAAQQLMVVVPSRQLIVLRVGKAAPAWRDPAIVNMLLGSQDWDWLYPWRLQTRTAVPWVEDKARPLFWPTETVRGTATVLPRRRSSCLNADTLAPALAELERTKTGSFIVWRDGAVEYERHWPGYGPDVRTESASMAKTVLALAVGQAVADGAVPSIDAPVSRWLTEWRDDPRGAITVRQLLQMTSGLAPLPFDMTPGSANSRFLLGPDANAVPLAATLANRPGSTFDYGSGVSQLLGLVLQRATGERYAQYLSRRLWQPIGAGDAAVALDRPGGMARTSGSLLARAEDWLRIGRLFAEDGGVVAPQWIAAMTAPGAVNPNYGLQLWRASPHAQQRGYNSASAYKVPAAEPFIADDTVFLDGAGGQRVYASRRERLVIVRTGAPAADWDDSRVANRVVQAARGCGTPVR